LGLAVRLEDHAVRLEDIDERCARTALKFASSPGHDLDANARFRNACS
jgi:hypothetical protein